MRSITRQLIATSKALSLSAALAVGTASLAVAQTADSTQPPPRPGMRGGMGPDRGMRPRFAPGPDFRPGQGGMPGRRGGLQRGMGMNAGRRFGPGPRALLRGITLSTDQEKALRSTQAKHLLEAKPLRLEMLSASTDAQLARLNGDQKALDAATARLTATRSKLDSLRAKRSPIESLRSVLTPDQQKILDKNLAERPAVGPGMRPGQRGGEGMRLRDGAGPRGFRHAVPPRRPPGGDIEDADFDDLDIPNAR